MPTPRSYRLNEKDMELLNNLKQEENLKSDGAAISFLLREHESNKEKEEQDAALADLILSKFEEKYYTLFERLRWATRTAEKNSIMLMDAVNTILVQQGINDCVDVDTYMSSVLETSEQIYKRKIAHFKQAKDERKAKNAEKASK